MENRWIVACRFKWGRVGEPFMAELKRNTPKTLVVVSSKHTRYANRLLKADYSFVVEPTKAEAEKRLYEARRLADIVMHNDRIKRARDHMIGLTDAKQASLRRMHDLCFITPE